VFCFHNEESIAHVFIHCNVAVTVWQHISKWLGLSFFMTVKVQQHFLKFGDLVKEKINKRFRRLVWFATMWCLWRSRNNIIFRGDMSTYPLWWTKLNICLGFGLVAV
jgi:mannosylglycoprotein endo-beta-mannosidase